MVRKLLSIFIAIALTPAPFAHAQNQSAASARVIVETDIRDDDSSRLTIDFKETSLSELDQIPEKLKNHADILPGVAAKVRVLVFVPKNLDPANRQQFLGEVERGLTANHPLADVLLVPLDIDVEQARRDKKYSNEQIETAQASLNAPGTAELARDLQDENNEILADLEKWETEMRGYSKRRDKRIGSVIGLIRGAGSAAVWLSTNGMTNSTLMQIAGSLFLDYVYSRHADDINNFKNSHRIPPFSFLHARLQNAVKFYNSRPLLKSWIFDSLVGFLAGSYFRFWSHVRDPVRTSAPWSWDALSTYGIAWMLGNIAAAVGSQGPRLLRKKGYLGSRLEYFMSISYGVLFQMGGFFYALGWNKAVIIHSAAQGTLEAGVYLIGRTLPLKDPRTLVIHPEFSEEQVEELLYRVGLRPEEFFQIGKEDLEDRIAQLKHWNGLNWKQKFAHYYDNVKETCAGLLGKKPGEE